MVAVSLKKKTKERKKKEKHLLRQYLKKFTGYSKAQLNRLIVKHYKGTLLKKTYNRNTFYQKYTREDILLIAYTDRLHKRPCGRRLRENIRREYDIFHKEEFIRLKDISLSHIYNLRKTPVYKKNTLFFDHTKKSSVDIGKRTKPLPNGKPGYIRIDSVHQGDMDGVKGVYHINCVDIVTQGEIVICSPSITWKDMRISLKEVLDQYPFVVFAFHSDNGSEYINYEVADMLNKLVIQLTKSRSRHSNDNALVESKNASVVRKHMGHTHIPKINAHNINQFYKDYLNLYINYHRPCLFATTATDKNGKQRKKYNICMTPYDKLKSLDNAEQYLKPGITFDDLDKIAYAMSDNEFAELMNKEKEKLFKNFIFPSH